MQFPSETSTSERAHPRLRECFDDLNDRPFVMVRPGGNFGDDLIYLGAEHLAESVGATWTSVDADTFLDMDVDPNAVLYLHGGGGFNSFYRDRPLQLLLHACRTHDGPIIQGPQTFEVTDTYLAHAARQLTDVLPRSAFYLFVRERTSYDALRRVLPASAPLCIDHDTALHLCRSDVLATSPRRFLRYNLHAIREDKEERDRPFVSLESGVQLDPAHYAKSFDHWVRLHANSRSITTNRTHSAIIGAILEIPTTVLPNAYHKNRSIWEYSLQERGVSWSPWPTRETSPSPSVDLQAIPGMKRLANSYKVQRTTNLLRGVPWY